VKRIKTPENFGSFEDFVFSKIQDECSIQNATNDTEATTSTTAAATTTTTTAATGITVSLAEAQLAVYLA
jgi:hypothetical protein